MCELYILIAEKDLRFLRIGSLNVRVKRTTEAFSNFLGVGQSSEKLHKTWGSADNIQQVTTQRKIVMFMVLKVYDSDFVSSWEYFLWTFCAVQLRRRRMDKCTFGLNCEFHVHVTSIHCLGYSLCCKLNHIA